jgi:hypothetical protein
VARRAQLHSIGQLTKVSGRHELRTGFDFIRLRLITGSPKSVILEAS